MDVYFDNSLRKKTHSMDVNDPHLFELFADEDSSKASDSLLQIFPDIKDYSNIITKVKVPLIEKIAVDSIQIDFDAIDNEFMKLTLPHFNFKLDNDEIVGLYIDKVDSLVAFLRKHESVHLRIIGHTDDQGSEQHNELLSVLRAKKVRELLIGKGINSARITCEGRGESQPVATNKTEVGKALNRRIEFEIFEN